MSQPQDPARGIAKQALKEHFTNKAKKPIKKPFYQSQLQILYEDDFFPWVVADALKELVQEGFLVVIDKTIVPELAKLRYVNKIKFFANKKAFQTEIEKKRMKVKIINISKLADKYSDPQNSEIIGKHLESLVKAELRAQQFDIIGIHSNEYNGIKWTKTQHDLDFIAKHNNGTLAVGVEVKNTLDLMDPEEIDIKIAICAHLGIVPVFAVRWIKPYVQCIKRQGGFCWFFKTQMYPLGSKTFTEELFTKLSSTERFNSKGHELQFPVKERTELPEKTIKIFSQWVTRHKNSPPSVNTAYRCKS